MVCLNRPHRFRFFKGCFQQILLSPFVNSLTRLLFPALYYIKIFDRFDVLLPLLPARKWFYKHQKKKEKKIHAFITIPIASQTALSIKYVAVTLM